jgi:hypothetical protein
MKDFVPHKEALELKQLGFDEPCFGFWSSENTYRRSINDSICNSDLVNMFGDEAKQTPSSPTWQQAFRWFREKYNLVHEICEHPKEMIDYVAVASKGERYLPTYSYGYSSNGRYHPISNTYIYEEGEIGCLKKFIEIVK